MTERTNILQNVQTFQAALAKYARDPARPPKLLVVTKNRSIHSILTLKEAGISEIGENQVQEIAKKRAGLGNFFAFHMIGRLQTNKIKYIINNVSMVQSVDHFRFAERIDERSRAAGIRIPILIQVNIGREPQKAGVMLEDTETLVRQCAKLSGVRVCGLMAMMPLTADLESLRPLFRSMRAIYERLRSQAIDGVDIAELSMGMSGDWRIAAQEGATIVRIGSAIFGERV
jgi:hypothetical protein